MGLRQVYYGLKRTSNPAPVVSQSELLSHIRLLQADGQTAELAAKARFAVEYIEEHTSHVAMPTSYLMTISRWPLVNGEPLGRQIIASGPIVLPRSPLISVENITYVDVNGVRQTLSPSAYQVRSTSEPPVIAPARMQFWPLSDPWTIDSVQIAFTAGYANPELIPERYREAVKFLAAHRYFNRESDEGEMPYSLKVLVSSLDVGFLE